MSISAPIQGRVALITGGLGGIAISYAKHLMMNGIKGIVLADKSTKNAHEIVREVETFGKGDVYFVEANTISEEQLRDCFDETVKKFNQLDIFISNAAVLDEKFWKQMIKTNFTSHIKGIFMAMKEYLPKYKSTDRTVIVHTSCVTALQPLQSLAVYSISKSGLLGFHKALSEEYWSHKYGCRFLAVCPGLTYTSLIRGMSCKGIDMDLYDEECCDWRKQEPDFCGLCLIKALNEGKNGSIWVCEGKQIYEWKIPDRYEEWKRIMKKPPGDCPSKSHK